MSEGTEPEDAELLDEVVSAVLDGEATALERARVEADPDARTRLEQLGELRGRLLATATPDHGGAGGRDLVAVAMAAAPHPHHEGGVLPAGAADLSQTAGPAVRHRGRPLALAGALAAAAVVVVVGIGVATRDQPSDLAGGALAESDATDEATSGDMSTTTASALDEPASAAATAPPALESRGDAETRQDDAAAKAPRPLEELGRAGDATELLERFEAAGAPSDATNPQGAASGFGSGGDGEVLSSACAEGAVAAGFVGDRRVVVVPAGDGFAVVDAATCEPLAG